MDYTELRKLFNTPFSEGKNMYWNEHDSALFAAVCEYIKSLGFTPVTTTEFEDLAVLVKNGKIVDAIKYLRQVSEKDVPAIIRPDEWMIRENDFYKFIQSNNSYKHLAGGTKMLGLKQAKNVVDVMRSVVY